MTAWGGGRGWRRAMEAAALVGLAMGVLACGTTAEEPLSGMPRSDELEAASCTDLAAEYAAAMPGAMRCEPTSELCTAWRPAVIRLYDGTPEGQLEGLSLCPVLVNAARTTELDAALQRFTAAGCELLPTPCFPPGRADSIPCRATADGAGSCSG